MRRQFRDKQEQKHEFPLFKMLFDDTEHWVSIKRAVAMYKSGFDRVEIGGLVLDDEGATRPIADKERAIISEIAEEYRVGK